MDQPINQPRGLREAREAIVEACRGIGVSFPPELLNEYEVRSRRKFEAHSWTWESRRALVLLSARWVGRLAGELAFRDGRTVVASPDAELAFTIARHVCYARAPMAGNRLDWCPDQPSPTSTVTLADARPGTPPYAPTSRPPVGRARVFDTE